METKELTKEKESKVVKKGLTVGDIVKINNALEAVADQKDLNQKTAYQLGKLKVRTEKVAEVYNKYRKKLLKEAQVETDKLLESKELFKSDLYDIQEFKIGRKQWLKVEEDINAYLDVVDEEFTVPKFKIADFNYTTFEKEDGKDVKVSKNALTARVIALMADYIEET